MERVATFEWRTPPPTSIDERLVLYDDGSAWLLALRPRLSAAGAVGTFVTRASDGDAGALRAAGPSPVVFELLHPPTDGAAVSLTAVADRVAAAARETPRAVATFHARGLGAPQDGRLSMSLLIVGSGTNAVEFGLEVAKSAVLFTVNGEAAGWQDLPRLETGFITPDAEGLGGVVQPGHVEPGAYGAIAFEVASPLGATDVSVRVSGWLREVLPDQATPEHFEVLTAPAPLEG